VWRYWRWLGLEGLSHHEKETNKLYKDQEKWKTWIEILLNTCTHPSIIGSCEHFLIICRKNLQSWNSIQ
jgi:hypothetical protein